MSITADSDSPRHADCELMPWDFAREIANIATSQLEYALEGRRRKIKVYESLKNLNEVIGTQYGDRVLFELVQNGHDAHPSSTLDGTGEIAVRLLISAADRGELLVANRGRAFTRSNLDSVINIGTSDKRIGEGIGNKGLGFRSVEALTDEVRIFSSSPLGSRGRFDGYCFRFATQDEIEADLSTIGASPEDARYLAATVPRYLVPKPVSERNDALDALAAAGFATVVSLPLRSVDAVALAERQVNELLDLKAPVLLFLDRLAALDVEIAREGASVIHRRSTRSVEPIADLASDAYSLAKVTVDGSTYLLTRSVLPKEPLLDAIRASMQTAPTLKRWLEWQGEAVVSVAIPLVGRGAAGRLYNFPPMTENATSPIAGHIDAPFFADIDRRSMKPDLPLNSHLLEAAATACAIAATEIVNRSLELPPTAVVDIAAWALPHLPKLLAAFRNIKHPLGKSKIWPVVSGGASNWASFETLYIWPEVKTGQMTTRRLAEVAEADILIDTLGADRVFRIKALAASINLPLELSDKALGKWTEAVANRLARERRASPTRWKTFLDDVHKVFDAAAVSLSSLEGRKILIDADGRLLVATAKGRDGAPPVFVRTKGGRGQRSEGPPRPPASLKRKFRFLSDAITLTEMAQRAFEKAGLLRAYDPLDVLLALKGALEKATDLQRQEALLWSFKVWRGGGGKQVEEALRAADLWVPTLGRWTRARSALFSGAWTSLGRTVEQYLVEAAAVSSDCCQARDRLLVSFGEWPRSGADDRREDWARFLSLLGTSDGLPPLAAHIGHRGTPSGHWNGILSTMSAKHGFDRAWVARVGSTSFQNPYTDYDLTGEIWRLPGQTEYSELPIDARAALSDLIVTFLRDHDDKYFQFSIEHYRHHNRVTLPTPLAVFLATAPWVANTKQDEIIFASPAASWSTTAARQPPPRFVPRFQSEVGARAALPAILFDPRIGLQDWSSRDNAAARLASLADSLEDLSAAERRDLRDQLRRAWSDVADTKHALPAGLSLVVERAGSLELCHPDLTNPPIVHVTSERQGFAARALADRGEAVLDIGENDGAAIARLIDATGGFRVQVADSSDVRLIVDGEDFEPGSDDPPLVADALAWLVDAAVLAHEYLGDPLELRTIPPDELERRLRQIRLRRCTSFALMIDGELAHARGDERAQPVAHPKLPTLVLVVDGAIGLDLLCEAAPAITKLMGVRRNTLETMLERMERAGYGGAGKPSDAQYARAIKRDESIIRDHFAATRSGIEWRLRALLPVVAHLVGLERAGDLENLHERVGPSLNLRSWLTERFDETIAERCLAAVEETDNQGLIRRAMGFDFAAYGETLAALGYPPLNDENDFRRMFEVYLGELKPGLLDRVRRRFAREWASGEDLAPYVAARHLDFVSFDPAWLRTLEALTREVVAARAAEAAEELLGPDDPAVDLPPLDRVAADNRKLVFAHHPDLAGLVRAWCRKSKAPVPASIEAVDPQTLVRALDEAGLLDFEKLDPARLPEFYARGGAWPAGMPHTADLSLLGLVPDDLQRDAIEAREAKQKAEAARRTIPFAGEDLDAGAGDFVRRFEALAAAAIKAGDDWFTRSRAPRLRSQDQRAPGTPGGGGGSGGQSWRAQPPEAVKTAMGIASEWLAREYLRRRHPKEMTDACWVSSNRAAFCTGPAGDDSFGYDFRVVTERNEWLYEVKSAVDSGGEFELTARELEVAGSASLERKRRYRILYVPFVFDPAQWRVLPLSNPAAPNTRERFRVLRGGSVRYRFERQ
ncbi:ATP-binding protein [Methylosinus sp. R-45379]|uniref:sacsin N-terminal ATP-binding-like domain-containing protein n=1 Tax=Methylosinus sp. R-45379 TaxID=980563 RepID=UPI000A987371|nr:ATP-binding protein [Methylosinus sp. R-45379]